MIQTVCLEGTLVLEVNEQLEAVLLLVAANLRIWITCRLAMLYVFSRWQSGVLTAAKDVVRKCTKVALKLLSVVLHNSSRSG